MEPLKCIALSRFDFTTNYPTIMVEFKENIQFNVGDRLVFSMHENRVEVSIERKEDNGEV